ncbi:MAG: type I-E CRISPR-associated protein Cas7/Cse4/CasC [Deltaproteobacteria bacterium]|nr:type I-E CRISPR-associated protein Cas7/Cse4/CasC [Deltaproteobacteria bacterium]
MLIEVHMLQNHAPSNLNRDDTGSPKEAVFGGYKRARISSQCLKRSIRKSATFRDLFRSEPINRISPKILEAMQKHGIEENLAYQLAVRTRAMPEIVKDILLAKEIDKSLAYQAAAVAAKLGAKVKDQKQETGDDGSEEQQVTETPESSVEGTSDVQKKNKTKQTMFLTLRDLEIVADYLADLIQKEKDTGLNRVVKRVSNTDKRMVMEKDLHSLGYRPITIDLALFGRMVTSEAFVDVEASSQFAHAISTHKIDHEFDYYTAVDDLERAADDEAGGGADMIGDVEFNSACYYKYFNVHVEGLVDNLTGKAFKRSVNCEDEKNARATAGEAIRALIETACRVTPSGKQNSFAAHQPPSLVWIEIRDKNLPVSYANAFCNPVNPKVRDGLETESANARKQECETLTKMYGLEARKRLLLAKNDDVKILEVSSSESLKTILDTVEAEVRHG